MVALACALTSLTLHLSLVVDNDSAVVLKVDEHTILPPPSLALSDHYCWEHLLTQLRLALLDCGHDHVSNTCSSHMHVYSTPMIVSTSIRSSGTGAITTAHNSRSEC
jgi:hypothetical protein